MKECSTQKGMKINVQIYLEDEQGFFESHQEILEEVHKVIAFCVQEEKVPYDVELSLTIVDQEEIHAINKEYREIDRPTDVLSFPQLDPAENGKILWDEIDPTCCMNLDTKEVMLGDIILCFEKADEQAKAYGHSLKREICFLVAHSMFHLLGYDHMNEKDEKLMLEKQEQVLQALNICR